VNFRGDLIRHLLAQGHEVFAMAPSGPEAVDARLADWGAHRVTVQLDRTGSSVLADLRLLRELVNSFRSIRPDVVLGYTIKPVVYGAIAARIAGVRQMAAMITGLGFAFAPPANAKQGLMRLFARMLYRAAMRCTDIVFFQNPDDEADFRRGGLVHPSHRVVRIHGSGVNLNRFAPQPLPAGPMRFLMIARLLADKGVREYVAAAASVRRVHPAVTFHLVGPFDGNPASVSAEEITAAAARGDIEFHGPAQDVRPHLAGCHVYVLPSYREGTPRSVLEAMAVGRAIVTTDAPGCRETVTNGHNGLLVPARDSHALAGAMLKLIAAPVGEVERMGRASHQLATSKYDVVTINAQIADTLTANA
jgi:glycosyltransferase involved in cell wall biosynthesis